MGDEPEAETPVLRSTEAAAAAAGSVLARRLEAEMAPLIARLDALEARVEGLESREVAGPTNSE